MDQAPGRPDATTTPAPNRSGLAPSASPPFTRPHTHPGTDEPLAQGARGREPRLRLTCRLAQRNGGWLDERPERRPTSGGG